MADLLDFAPVRVFTSNAGPGAGYIARFYQSGTTTPVTVFTDASLGTAWGTSITADAEGKFATVFSAGGAIKATIETPAGAVVATIDPVQSVPSGSAAASAISFAPTVDLPFTNVQAAIEGAAASAASGFAAFGLGVTGSVALLAGLDATNIASGQYRFDATTTGTYPSGVLAADTGAIRVERETAGSAFMWLYHDTSDGVWLRRMNSSTWGAWQRVAAGATATGLSVVQAATAAAGRAALGITQPVLITRTTLASAAATIDFTGFNPALYREYEFRLRQVLPVTDAAQLWLRTSTNAGSTYDAGASDYNFAAYTQASAGGDAAYGAVAAQFQLSGSGATSGVGNAANEIGVFGSVRLFSPNTARFCPIQAETHYQRAGDGLPAQDRQWGHRVAAADVDAVRFLFSTGNIAAGSVIEFWGIAL